MTEAELPSTVLAPPRPRPATPLRVAGWLLLLGGAGILLASRQDTPAEILPPGTVSAGSPQAPQPPMLPPGYWEQTRSVAPEIVGPPAPTPGPKMAAGKSFPRTGGAGPIGYLGPIPGPLNADAGGGPVYGPGWDRKPLPNIVAGPPIPTGLLSPKPPVPTAPADPTSSELPDEKTVALSRLANPQLEVRQAAPAKVETATAENPLSVQISLKDHDFRVGEPVTVRVSANIACYTALVLVDSAGTSSTLFQSTRPTRQFTCLLKAGPTPGAEYLLAVASMQPLGSTEVASSLRAAGTGFSAPRVSQAAGEAPAAAWTLALAHVDSLDGAAKRPQRFEWGSSTATFVTQPPVVTANKPKAKLPVRKEEPKEARPAPASDESTLPKSEPAEPKGGGKPAESPDEGSVAPE